MAGEGKEELLVLGWNWSICTNITLKQIHIYQFCSLQRPRSNDAPGVMSSQWHQSSLEKWLIPEPEKGKYQVGLASTKPVCLEPVLCNKRRHCNEKLMHSKEEQPHLLQLRKPTQSKEDPARPNNDNRCLKKSLGKSQLVVESGGLFNTIHFSSG